MGNAMGNKRRVKGRRRTGTGCSAEWTLDGRLPGRGWLRTAAWSRTRSLTDESARGQGEDTERLGDFFCMKQHIILSMLWYHVMFEMQCNCIFHCSTKVTATDIGLIKT